MRVPIRVALAGWFTLCVVAGRVAVHGQTAPPLTEAASFEQRKAEYLKRLLPTAEKVRNFIGEAKPPAEGYHPNAGWTFHPEVGWVVQDTIRYDGINGSRTLYRYEPSGTRKESISPTPRLVSTPTATVSRIATKSATARPGRSTWPLIWASRSRTSGLADTASTRPSGG